MIYISDLYKKIIIANKENATKLRVCSGYSSSDFVKKVLEECPDLFIELFLGMTPQGMSLKNHLSFLELIEENEDRLKVWYQIEEVPTHIKCYTYYENDVEIVSYIGSANFTFNGFIHWREMLSSSKESLSKLYFEQEKISKLATFEFISDYVQFYEDDVVIEEETEEMISTVQDSSEIVDQIFYASKSPYKYRETLSIIPERFPSWKRKGINAFFNEEIESVSQTALVQFDTIFPMDRIFEVRTSDGKKFESYVDSSYSIKKMTFQPSLFKYISGRIDHDINNYLTRDILIKNKMNEIRFKKLQDDSFLMLFEADEN